MLASGSPASQHLSAEVLCYMSTRLCIHEHQQRSAMHLVGITIQPHVPAKYLTSCNTPSAALTMSTKQVDHNACCECKSR